MRSASWMSAAAAALGGLGLLAGIAIGSSSSTPAVPVRRPQPVEVRTQVVRKTVWVYKKAHPAAAGSGKRPAGGAFAPATAAAPSTRTSGHSSAGAVPAAPVVSTRTSGTHTSAC